MTSTPIVDIVHGRRYSRFTTLSPFRWPDIEGQRADQPYVLRFSDRPAVVFTSPSADPASVFKRGMTIDLAAVLLDPSLDSIVRGLDDTTQRIGERPFRDLDGQIRNVPVYAPLVPQVSIRNAAGKEVASGTMPFG